MTKMYCFERIEKKKNASQVERAYRHNFRIGNVVSANPELEHLNDYIIRPDTDDINKVLEERLKKAGYDGIEKKVRKNAVPAIEIVMDYSSEAAEQIDIEKWKQDNIKWLRNHFETDTEKYGSNIIAVVYHGDEQANDDGQGKQSKGLKNGHMHALIQPIDKKGKLKISSFIDGRKDMSELQNSYYEEVGIKYGLERGEKGSISPHESQRMYNRKLAEDIANSKINALDGETIKEYEERVNEIRTIEAIQNRKTIERQKKEIYAKETNIKNLKQENMELKEQLAELGDIKLMEKKSQAWDDFQYALKYFPDRKGIDELCDKVNNYLKWGKEFNDKQRKEER